jgi:hypothetical protein
VSYEFIEVEKHEKRIVHREKLAKLAGGSSTTAQNFLQELVAGGEIEGGMGVNAKMRWVSQESHQKDHVPRRAQKLKSTSV